MSEISSDSILLTMLIYADESRFAYTVFAYRLFISSLLANDLCTDAVWAKCIYY